MGLNFKTPTLSEEIGNFKKKLRPESECVTFLTNYKDTPVLFEEMDEKYKRYIMRMIGKENMVLLFLGFLIAKKTRKLQIFGIHWSILNFVASKQPFITFCHLKEFTFESQYSGEEIMGWLSKRLDDFSIMEEAFEGMPRTNDNILHTDCFLFSLFLDRSADDANLIVPLFRELANFYYNSLSTANPADAQDCADFVGQAPYFDMINFYEAYGPADSFSLATNERVEVVSDGAIYQYIKKHEKVLQGRYSARMDVASRQVIQKINSAMGEYIIESGAELEDSSIGANIITATYIQTSSFVVWVLNLVNQHFLQNHGFSYYTGTGWKYAEFEDTSKLFIQITGIKVYYQFSAVNLKNRISHSPCPFLIPESDGTVLNIFTEKREMSSPALAQLTRMKRNPQNTVKCEKQLRTFSSLYKFHHFYKYTSSLQVILYHPLVNIESGFYDRFEHVNTKCEFHTIEPVPYYKLENYVPTPITWNVMKSIIHEMDDPYILMELIQKIPNIAIGLIRIFATGIDSYDFLEELFSVSDPIFEDFNYNVTSDQANGETNFLESIERMSIFDEFEDVCQAGEEERNWPSIIPAITSWKVTVLNIDKFHCLQALKASLHFKNESFNWEKVPIPILQNILIILVGLSRKKPSSSWYSDDLKAYFQFHKHCFDGIVPWEDPILFKSTTAKLKIMKTESPNLQQNLLFACDLLLQFSSYDLDTLIYLLSWAMSIGCLGNQEKTFLLILGSSNCGKSKLIEYLTYCYQSGTPNVISNATIQDSSNEINSSALPTTTNFFVNVDEFNKASGIVMNKLVSDTVQSFRIMKTQKFQDLLPIAKLILTTNRIPSMSINEGLKTRMRCLKMEHSYRPLLANGKWSYGRGIDPQVPAEYAIQLGLKMFPIGINEKSCQEGIYELLEGICRKLLRKNPLAPMKLPPCARVDKDTSYVFGALDPYTKYLDRTKIFNGTSKPNKSLIENDVHEISKMYRFNWDTDIIQSIVENCLKERRNIKL